MERVAGMVKVRADKYLQWLKSPWKRVYELWAYDFQYMIDIYILYRYRSLMTHWTLPLCSTVPGFPTIYFFGPPGSRCLWLGWDIFIGCIWQICREVPTLQNLGCYRRLPRFWIMNMLVPGCSGICPIFFCLPSQWIPPHKTSPSSTIDPVTLGRPTVVPGYLRSLDGEAEICIKALWWMKSTWDPTKTRVYGDRF